MLTVKEMCVAHLTNVQKAIEDLRNQAMKIQEEINKLENYLSEGKSLLTNLDVSESGDTEE